MKEGIHEGKSDSGYDVWLGKCKKTNLEIHILDNNLGNPTVVTMFDYESESRQIFRSDDFTYKYDPSKTSNKVQISPAMILFDKQLFIHAWIRLYTKKGYKTKLEDSFL